MNARILFIAAIAFTNFGGVVSGQSPIDFKSIRPVVLVEVPGSPEMEPWSEAPIWRDGEVFFSNRPFVRVGKGNQPVKYLNLHVAGAFLRANGHILVCEHFNKALLDIALDGTVAVVADRDEHGRPLRGLNDVTADAAGNVYWSDPADSSVKNPTGRVYRVTPSGAVEMLANDLAFPNGIEVDPSNRNLYVIESQTRKVLRYELPAAGQKLRAKEVFFDFGQDSAGGDGLCFDAEGNAWMTEFTNKSGTGRVVVVSPKGKLLGEVKPAAKFITNITFGGETNDEIFISTGAPSGVFRAKVGTQGFRGHPVLQVKTIRSLKLNPLNEPISTVPSRLQYAELRIEHAAGAGKTAANLERLEAGGWDLLRKHGLNPLACWVSIDGNAKNAVVVQLLAPPSETAAREGWSNLVADAVFRALEAQSEAKHGKIVERIEVLKLTAPADAWKLNPNNNRPKRVFDLRLYSRLPEKEIIFRDRWRDHAIRLYERHGMDNLGWWEATDAEHRGVMATLFAHESQEAINSAIAAFHKDEDWIRVEKETESNGKLRSTAAAYRLVPARFSPLK